MKIPTVIIKHVKIISHADCITKNCSKSQSAYAYF